MTLKQAIKTLSNFVAIDGAWEKELKLLQALKIVVTAAERKKK